VVAFKKSPHRSFLAMTGKERAMIEAVARVDAAALIVASSQASRQGTLRRQRRLRWLAALNGATGEDALPAWKRPDDDSDDADERNRAELGARIGAALRTIDELEGQAGRPAPVPMQGGFTTATELARRIDAARDTTLRAQARLGAAAVRVLVGDLSHPA
jgi:hypothetical protein